MAVTVI